jgi:hypothetical protein
MTRPVEPILTRSVTSQDLIEADDDLPELGSQLLTSTLPLSATAAYEMFCEIDRVPEWLSVARSARVLEWDDMDRPLRVAFRAEVQRGLVGYTLHYTYCSDRLEVSWTTHSSCGTKVAGSARFTPLGPKACMIHYELIDDLAGGKLPEWDDPFFESHAASAVVAGFRDWIKRQLH